MKLILLALCAGLAFAAPSSDSYYSEDYNVRDAFGSFKQFLSTDEGVNLAREYIRSLEAEHPVLFMVKAFVESVSNEVLVQLLQEVMKDIEIVVPADFDPHQVSVEIENFLRTDEGVQAVKDYFQNLKTSHPIISRLRTMVVSASDETIREFIDAILPVAVYYLDSEGSSDYDVREQLLTLFKKIRALLDTDEGIRVVKDYARALDATHPVLFLVKAFISSADDGVLREILVEVFKGVEYISLEYNTVAEQLEDLFLQVRDIVKTEEGFRTLKNYIGSLRSTHPIVARVSAFISNASDETLHEIMDALFGDSFLYAAQILGTL